MAQNKDYKLLIFDWDGTLMNSEFCIVNALQATGRELNFPIPTSAAIHNTIGLPVLDSMRKLFPEAVPEVAADIYRKHYFSSDENECFFEGAHETLCKLKQNGYKLAIATNKSRRGLDHAIQRLQLEGFFEAIRCGDDGFAKPHPDVLSSLLTKTDVVARDALMIGDTIYDMQAAANAGVDALAVTYGVHSKEQLLTCNTVGCIDDIRQLVEWLAY